MKIKELLKKPSSWTKHAFARNAKGVAVDSNDSTACCFCLMGAVRHCYPEYEQRKIAYMKLSEAVKQQTGNHDNFNLMVVEEAWKQPTYVNFMPIGQFNDDPKTKHADILAVAELADV